MSAAVQEGGGGASRAHPQRVLVVEHDEDSRKSLQSSLAGAGFSVAAFSHGEDIADAIDRERPDLVMVDWEYPGSVTSHIVRHLQREVPATRALLMALSLYSGEQQIVSGFELGVDDYVVRPYSPSVLLARVRAVLRSRNTVDERQWLEFHQLRMDLDDHRLMIEDRVVRLRPMEFRLLKFLMRHPERVFTREQLISHVWTRDAAVDARAVDVIVQRTRKALTRHDCGGYLQTVRAFGYRLSVLVP